MDLLGGSSAAHPRLCTSRFEEKAIGTRQTPRHLQPSRQLLNHFVDFPNHGKGFRFLMMKFKW
jgi:hypothetical protein